MVVAAHRRIPPRRVGAPASLDTARRMLDVAGGLVLLVLALPILLPAALLVLVTSGRPVFFGHVRVGLGGRPFRCWKLRTMTPGAELRLVVDDELRRRHERNGYKLPVREDPRVTRVGRWLRRSYLDELPQVLNVLAGDMALVGPRPVVEEELAEFGPDADELLSVKPGLVGAWSSLGRARPAYPERARLELEYVRARTLRRDLRILLRALPAVARGQAG